MHPTTDAKQTNPHHVLSSHADEELARIQQQLSRLKRDAARHPARRSRDRPWLRGLIGLFIAACIAAAAFVSQSSYRDAVARWAPQLISASSPPPEKPSAINARVRATQAQVAAATAVAERVTAATAVVILMARSEIKSLSDLAGRNIAIDDKHSAARQCPCGNGGRGSSGSPTDCKSNEGDRPGDRRRGAGRSSDVGISGSCRRVS